MNPRKMQLMNYIKFWMTYMKRWYLGKSSILSYTMVVELKVMKLFVKKRFLQKKIGITSSNSLEAPKFATKNRLLAMCDQAFKRSIRKPIAIEKKNRSSYIYKNFHVSLTREKQEMVTIKSHLSFNTKWLIIQKQIQCPN